YPMAPEQVASVEGKEGCEIQNLPSILVLYLGMNQLKKPFSDIRVRQALNYALNKKALAKVVHSGFLDPLESTMSPGVEFYARQGTWEYDPEKAKTLLREAGVNAGEKLLRRAGVKMHHGLRRRAGPVQVSDVQTQLSSSINEPAFPSRPGITPATARSVGDGRSGATRSTASMASTGPSPQ